jgi:hypothetical protein
MFLLKRVKQEASERKIQAEVSMSCIGEVNMAAQKP